MRNVYHKVGMFGTSAAPGNTGDQIRGFGYLHDGSIDTVFNFLGAGVFGLNNNQQRDLEAFSLRFPTDLAPMVGQQVTLSSSNFAAVNPRIDLMIARAGTSFDSFMLGGTVTECEVIAKGSEGGEPRGWLRESNGDFRSDIDTVYTNLQVRNLINTDGPVTYTCVPPGSGERMGIDRDEDDVLDGLDNCPSVPNTDQTNTNLNQYGDACDPVVDIDGDGVLDVDDNCIFTPNPGQEDADNDGIGDACEAIGC